MAVRKESKRARLFRKAKFPCVKSFEGHDFPQAAFPDSYGANHPKTLSFVEAAQGPTFHGQTGRRETHLAIAVGHACVIEGKTRAPLERARRGLFQAASIMEFPSKGARAQCYLAFA